MKFRFAPQQVCYSFARVSATEGTDKAGRAVMSTHATDKQATIVPSAQVSKGQQDNSIVTDNSGRAVLALLQKAAEMAKDDCARAISGA